MPTSEKVLGFSNRWYDLAIETAVERELGSGVRIRAVSPPVVIESKLAGRVDGELVPRRFQDCQQQRGRRTAAEAG